MAASKVLRTDPIRGLVHPQFLPSVWGIGRWLSGKDMGDVVASEIEEYRQRKLHTAQKQVDEYAGTPHADKLFLAKEALGRAQKGEGIVTGYLNNFVLQVLDGGYRRIMGESGNWDVPNRKIPDDMGHSRVFLRQTPREFYGVVDRALTECGVDKAEIERLWEEKKMEHVDKVDRLILPAYVKLREWGYKHGELTI